MIDFAKLSAPFAPDEVEWRVGSTTGDKKKGMALAYIDSRAVQDRLDAVCGPSGWQCRYPHVDKKTCCEIGIKIGDEWVWKADGAGDSDVEAEKGAFSDAFKRAAVKWGIGRYLYDLPSPWVALEPAGRSFKIADSEHAKLRAVLTRGRQAPAENVSATPVGRQEAKAPANADPNVIPPPTDNTGTAWTEWCAKVSEAINTTDEVAGLAALQTANEATIKRLEALSPKWGATMRDRFLSRFGMLHQAPLKATG